jgi:hypothetical protein
MRICVALFMLVIGLETRNAFADGTQYRNKGEFDSACRDYSSTYLRDAAFNDARGAFCLNAAKMFCAEDSGLCGNGGSSRQPIQVRLPQTINPETVRAEVQRIQGRCRDMGQKADQCCQVNSSDNPNCPTERVGRQSSDGTTKPAPQNGQSTVKESFAQSRDMHDGVSLSFASYGGACYGRIEACVSQCSAAKAELARRVQGVACEGCLDMINGMQSEIDQCESKRSQVTLAFQGVRDHTDASLKSEQGRKETESNSSGRGKGDRVAGGQGMNPMSMIMPLASALLGALNQQNQQQPAQQPFQTASLDQTDCTVNPYLAGCNVAATAQQQSDSWNKPKGDSFTPAGEEGGNFNVGNLADGMNAAASADGAEPFRAQPAAVASVPNGGGGMPGGASGGAASLGSSGSGGGGGGSAGARGKDVQITEQGGGGGYQQMNASMDMKTGGSGGYNYGAREPASEYQGLDLSQFLPGGKQDPTRRLAGARAGGTSIEIQSKDVNIWNRISDRIRSRCNQGLLRDCVP